MTKIQHLMEALHHLNQVEGFELEKQKIKLSIQSLYSAKTEKLEGEALIDRLSDEELIAAIRIRDPRLGIYNGPHIDPFKFNYVRHTRSAVASIAFS